jgi:hypothetical protein
MGAQLSRDSANETPSSATCQQSLGIVTTRTTQPSLQALAESKEGDSGTPTKCPPKIKDIVASSTTAKSTQGYAGTAPIQRYCASGTKGIAPLSKVKETEGYMQSKAGKGPGYRHKHMKSKAGNSSLC